MTDRSLHLMQSQRLLEALQSASTDTARSSVLILALISFDHTDEQAHDDEVKLGADFIICFCLRRAVAIEADTIEIDRLCRLLECIYKCTDAIAATSYCQHGAILIPLLVTIASSSSGSLRSKMVATRLLQRTDSAELAISEMKDSDLLLIAMVRFLRQGTGDCQNNALTALFNISHQRESKATLARFPGLVEAVIQSAETCAVGALRLLASLSWDSRNKEGIVNTRGFLFLLRTSAASKEPEILYNVCRCLEFLSSANMVNRTLVTFESGVLVDRLAKFLTVESGDNKLRVLETIANLVSESSADVIGNTTNLIQELGDIASSIPATDCSVVASKAIKRLSCYLRTRHSGHQTLSDALLKMAKSTSNDVSLWTARAYIEQSLSASNSFFMVRCQRTIGGILGLAESKHDKVHSSAVEAIANLSQEAANARRLSAHDSVVQMLIECVQRDSKTGAGESARREAVRAILLIANHSSSSKRVAKHQGLIQALSRYGTSEDEDVELKRAALFGVLMLAPCM